jgi:DNA-binding transcriptional MocR family regulator
MNWLDVFTGLNRERGRSLPMYAQLVGKIKDGIASGQLADNSRLPTNRELAELLKIDRSTVSRAYMELEDEGLVDSHVGRGTFVRLKGAAAKSDLDSKQRGSNSMIWPEKFSRSSQTAFGIISRQPGQTALGANVISFAGGIPSEEFYPFQAFGEIVSQFIGSNRSGEMFGYSDPEGHPHLRNEVRKYLARQGIEASEDELLIVSGSQQAIDLVSHTLIDPGDIVLVEEPTYFWALCNFAAGQARCLPVPVDSHGLQVDVLEAILSRQRVKMLYTIPTFQNPTGSTLSLERRRRLIELAQRYQMPILEDNFVGDLRYAGEPLPSLRAVDRAGKAVIHQGTFSKALCPGLRLGWLVAPAEVMSRLQLSKRASDLSTNSMSQVIMAEYLRRGFYEKHLDQIRRVYKSRLDTMCGALQKLPGGSVTWSTPEGGLFIWVKLPDGYSSRELLTYAERESVTFSPGDMFFVNGDRPEFLRLSFVQTDESTIEEGIRRFGRALSAYTEGRRHFKDTASLRGREGTWV